MKTDPKKQPAIQINVRNEHDALVLELRRLLECYQLASQDDKNVVWAALNKYACQIDI